MRATAVLCSSAALCAVAPALLLFPTPSSAHERHFPGHPEWDNLWPDPVTLNDVGRDGAGGVLDLSGVWKGSPKAGNEHRYFFTPSGGGYGSGELGCCGGVGGGGQGQGNERGGGCFLLASVLLD